MTLADRTCVPCRGEEKALTLDQIGVLMEQLDDWTLENDKKLVKIYRFDNFKKAMDSAVRIAAIAEEQNHHPDLIVKWGELRIEIWTHANNALTENDFILAAKIDQALVRT